MQLRRREINLDPPFGGAGSPDYRVPTTQTRCAPPAMTARGQRVVGRRRVWVRSLVAYDLATVPDLRESGDAADRACSSAGACTARESRRLIECCPVRTAAQRQRLAGVAVNQRAPADRRQYDQLSGRSRDGRPAFSDRIAWVDQVDQAHGERLAAFDEIDFDR